MELVEGQTLAEWLVQQRSHETNGNEEQPAPSRRGRYALVCRWAAEVASGLAHAHAHGVIHRDIKPSNLIVGPQGHIKILDFGVAKLRREAGLTATGALLGTPRYMSPEQFSPDQEIDHRADIYSLGATLYELWTLAPPFPGDDLSQVINAITSSDPRPLRQLERSVPRELEAICLRAMARDPKDRYQAAEDLASDLHAYLTGGRVLAMRHVTLSRLIRSVRHNRYRVALVAAVLLILAAFATMPGRQSRLTLENPQFIWQGQGFTADPSFSHDGRCLVVSSDRGGEGHADIWLQEFDRRGVKRGEPIQLTFESTDETEPAVSPNRGLLAYCKNAEGGGLFLQELREQRLVGDPRRIDEHGRGPKFSPDGKWLAYWRGSICRALSTRGDSVWIVPTAGGPPRRICRGFKWVSHPIWSPDSSRLLFRGAGPGEDQRVRAVLWWTMPIAGQPIELVNIESNSLAELVDNLWYCVPTCWTSQDDHVILSGFHSQGFNLLGVPISQHAVRGGMSYPITKGGRSELYADADANGRCCYADMEFDYGVFRLPIDADCGTVTGPISVVTENRAMELHASASKDGNTIVFHTDRDGDFDIYARVNGQKASRLIGGRGTGEGYPIITRGGEKLQRFLRFSGIATSRASLFVADLEQGVAKGNRKVADGRHQPIDWHPSTPARLLLVMRGPGLHLLDTETGDHQSVLEREGWQIDCGRFSPDGRWIAFSAHKLGDDRHKQVFVVPFDQATQIQPDGWIPISDGEGDHSPDWSPNGKIVYYLSDRDGRRDVWCRTLEPQTKQPQGTARQVYRFLKYRQSPVFVDSSQLLLTVTQGQLLLSLGDCTGDVCVGQLELR